MREKKRNPIASFYNELLHQMDILGSPHGKKMDHSNGNMYIHEERCEHYCVQITVSVSNKLGKNSLENKTSKVVEKSFNLELLLHQLH